MSMKPAVANLLASEFENVVDAIIFDDPLVTGDPAHLATVFHGLRYYALTLAGRATGDDIDTVVEQLRGVERDGEDWQKQAASAVRLMLTA
jgi:hypothetical protein